MDIPYIKLNETGLERFFGPLEAKIMDIIWSSGGNHITIKFVHDQILKEQDISFNTVMTVMNRLCEKGHLIKKGERKSTSYSASMSKEEFISKQAGKVTQLLFNDFNDYVVSNMLDALEEADENLVNQLEQKLKELKGRKKNDID